MFVFFKERIAITTLLENRILLRICKIFSVKLFGCCSIWLLSIEFQRLGPLLKKTFLFSMVAFFLKSTLLVTAEFYFSSSENTIDVKWQTQAHIQRKIYAITAPLKKIVAVSYIFQNIH